MSLLENLQDNDWVTAAIQRGARQALIKHKAMGVPIAIWKDGKVVLVPPEDIEIPDAPENRSSAPRGTSTDFDFQMGDPELSMICLRVGLAAASL